MARKQIVVGLHLWEVVLLDSTDNLWVTTRARSSALAARKAERFLRKNRDVYPDAKVEAIHSRGTLDA